MTRNIDGGAPRVVKNLQGGPGEVKFYDLASGEALFGHARLFSRVVLEPGAGIGWHVHRGEGEIYYILSGDALYDDNGVKKRLSSGDAAVCGDGEGHSIQNCGAESLEFIAIIPTK